MNTTTTRVEHGRRTEAIEVLWGAWIKQANSEQPIKIKAALLKHSKLAL